MEAATSTDATRKLDGDKAQRIIAAMRASVGTRGASGSTFDHVAREAGVSRGLLHYYFGSKEQLLVEVVRHDCEVRNRNMDERLEKAHSVDEILDALVVGLEEFLEDDAGGQAVIYEMLSASRHSEEIRAELAELYRQWRERLAGWLRTKEREGVIRLQADPEAVASILFSLGDGFGIQVLADPDWDQQAAFDLGVRYRAPPARRRRASRQRHGALAAMGSAGRPAVLCAGRATCDPESSTAIRAAGDIDPRRARATSARLLRAPAAERWPRRAGS